jgi:alpha-D-ribose 1-methylphosphonate 5-triphosphate synthase subunit PhnL
VSAGPGGRADPSRRHPFAFVDEEAKREIRRKLLKAVAIPGYQVPFASRELPIARGWGTGGLQVTMALIGPDDVVAEPLVLLDQPRELARRRAADVLTRLRLPRELRDAHPVNFSGGEKQRVNVARACLMRPRLLLVDEPTAALDPETKRDVVGRLRELKAEGVAILAVLHDRAVVEHLADEVVHMEGGRACPAIS